MAVDLDVNRKRIQRLMRILGIEAHYPKPNLSRPAPGHQIYPYLLRGVEITPAQPRLEHRYYLHSDAQRLPVPGRRVMDWFSRFVLSWELSNTMETGFCLAALNAAFRFGQPEIWNSDQGAQFTSADFLAPPGQATRDRDQYMDGVPRTRQRVHRTAVALTQIRTDLPRRLRHRRRSVSGSGRLLPLLQPPASAPGAGVSDAGRSVPVQIQKEAVMVLMGALPPTPRDLTLLFSRMDGAFLFTRNSTCRTIENACQEDRATQGCDPSADSSPEWMAASRPPPESARQTI